MLTIKELNIDAYRYLIVIPQKYLYKYLIYVHVIHPNTNRVTCTMLR